MAKKKAKKTVVRKRKLAGEHAGHASHLCVLVAKRQMTRAAKLSKNAKFICHICGRAAARAANLCEPVEI